MKIGMLSFVILDSVELIQDNITERETLELELLIGWLHKYLRERSMSVILMFIVLEF